MKRLFKCSLFVLPLVFLFALTPVSFDLTSGAIKAGVALAKGGGGGHGGGSGGESGGQGGGGAAGEGAGSGDCDGTGPGSQDQDMAQTQDMTRSQDMTQAQDMARSRQQNHYQNRVDRQADAASAEESVSAQ